jgi:membrane-bound ClpP family serine protease
MALLLQLLIEQWLVVVIVVLAIVVMLIWLTVKAHQQKVSTGYEGIKGEQGVYKGNNLALVHGELWKIEAKETLEPGDLVEVIAVDKLLLTVKKSS